MKPTYDPIKTYHRKIDKKELLRAIRWWKANLMMSDWRIDLRMGGRRFGWGDGLTGEGCSNTHTCSFCSEIYIDVVRCGVQYCPLCVLMHELAHIWLYANHISTHDEGMVNLLEGLFYKAYCLDMNVKPGALE